MVKAKIIIFTGTSISKKEASTILDADYRDPVSRGEITLALKENPDIIGIIDGVFHQKPAVSHREILDALQSGVIVVGGASMGALRASELDEMGMIGKGEIYQSYKEGIIESDDDVALVFNPITNEQLSEALITMSQNFKRALERGIINEDDYDNLYQTAKNIYYPKRTYELVFRQSALGKDKINALNKFIEQEGKDIKYSDALEVINYIKFIEDGI
jgi:hypothetical protein